MQVGYTELDLGSCLWVSRIESCEGFRMNPAHTVLRSNYSLVYICFSVTTNTRKKITQTEQMYLVPSCWNTLTLHFARVLSTKDYLASICIVKNQTYLQLQLHTANTVWLQSACKKQRGCIPGAQSWFSTFSNSFFPPFYFKSTTERKGHSLRICLLWRPQSVGSWHWTSTQRAEPIWGCTVLLLSPAGHLGHGILFGMQTRAVLIEERLISVYGRVCKSCQKSISNNSLAPTDVSRN